MHAKHLLIGITPLCCSAQSPLMGPEDHAFPGLVTEHVRSYDAFSVGPGEDHVWNLSGMSTLPAGLSHYLQPGTTPGHENFPSSNYVVRSDAAPDWYFYQSHDENGWYSHGGWNSALNGGTVYSDPEQDLLFPCEWGTAWTDDYSYTSTGSMITVTGQAKWAAVGYGTLHMPTATVYDVLLLQRIDTTVWGQEDPFDGTISMTQVFVAPGHAVPLAKLFLETDYFEGEAMEPSYTTDFLAGVYTDVNELTRNAGPSLWPQPCTTVLNVARGDDPCERIEILDVSGRMIRQIPWTGAVSMTIEVGELSSGTYLLRSISQRSGMRTQQFMVE